MNNIKLINITKLLNFDKIEDDMFGELFSKKQIEKDFSYENIIVNPLEILPKDYLWYMENYGSRTVRNMEYRVDITSKTAILIAFSGCESPESSWRSYCRETGSGSYESYHDEGDFILNKRFLPFSSENDGEMLLMDIKEDIGTIWQYPSKQIAKKYDLTYEPTFVAQNFTEFLALLKPIYSMKNTLVEEGFKEMQSASNVWKKDTLTVKELLRKTIAEYEKDGESYTEFKDLNAFINILELNASEIKSNGARAVELYFLSYGGNWTIKNKTDLEINIQKVLNIESKTNLAKKRDNTKVKQLEPCTNNPYYIGEDHDFYQIKVESTMNGLECVETFILYKNPNSGLLSFIQRSEIEIEDMKVKGIGTFEYNEIWSTKRRKRPKWSSIPATIYLDCHEEDLTEEFFEFIREIINDNSFKETVEEKIFKRYQTVDYLEFLEMSKDEREEWEDAYPKIDVPTEIWRLLGDKIDIYFYSDKSYELFFEYAPDPEHGLTLMIKDKKNIDLK